MTYAPVRDASRELTLKDAAKLLWHAKACVLAGFAAGITLALITLAFTVPQYRVTMLAGPAENESVARINAPFSDSPDPVQRYLASTMEKQETTDFIRFEHTMRESTVAAALMNDKRIQEGLAASRKFLFQQQEEARNASELSAYLRKNISIEPVGNSPLRRIVFDHPSGDFGAYLLLRLHEETDRTIRASAVEKAEKRRGYLQRLLDRTTHPDHRRALTSLLMEQEHILMILAMDEPFAALVAELPSVSARQQWPRKPLFIITFAFAGMALGFFVHNLSRR